MDNDNVVHIHNAILFSSKENVIMKILSKLMKMGEIILGDVTEVHEEKCTFLLICGS